MSNRRYRGQYRYSFEARPVDLFARITFGATGAPTIDTANSVGIKSIVRNSAGDYTMTLSDQYLKLRLLDYSFDTTGTAGAAPAAPSMWVKAQSTNAAGGGTLRFVFNAAGTATDPANGEAVLMQVMLNDSNVTI